MLHARPQIVALHAVLLITPASSLTYPIHCLQSHVVLSMLLSAAAHSTVGTACRTQFRLRDSTHWAAGKHLLGHSNKGTLTIAETLGCSPLLTGRLCTCSSTTFCKPCIACDFSHITCHADSEEGQLAGAAIQGGPHAQTRHITRVQISGEVAGLAVCLAQWSPWARSAGSRGRNVRVSGSGNAFVMPLEGKLPELMLAVLLGVVLLHSSLHVLGQIRIRLITLWQA